MQSDAIHGASDNYACSVPPCVSKCNMVSTAAAQVAATTYTPGDFDCYIFVQFWTPEACYTESDSACDSLSDGDYATTNFMLHGLWPQFDSSQGGATYPSVCCAQKLP